MCFVNEGKCQFSTVNYYFKILLMITSRQTVIKKQGKGRDLRLLKSFLRIDRMFYIHESFGVLSIKR